MKKHFILVFMAFTGLLLLPLSASSQQFPEQASLQLTHLKTTSLIFPFTIRHVDRGSPDILAHVPRETGNVLQVKAARKKFPDTNLTVITSDGKLYTFPVSYRENPETMVIQPGTASSSPAPVALTGSALNEAQLKALCHQLAGDSRFYYGIKDRTGKTKATLEGIYTYGNMLFFRVVLVNTSPLPYTLDFIRFSIRDRKRIRRTATQEEAVMPAYQYGLEERQLANGEEQVLVIAVDKTDMTPKKELVMDLFEREGARQLQLRVRHRHLLQALPLWWGITL